MLLIIVFCLGVRLTQGREKATKTELNQFEAVGLNIFVPATLTSESGRSTTAYFIVDTGTTRTTIDTGVAQLLDLKPHGVSNNITPSGKVTRFTTLVSNFSSLHQSSSEMEVLVDDLSLYSSGYRRPVAGLLAMDFLKHYVLVIDMARSQIGLLSRNEKVEGLGRLRRINLTKENGLFLAPVVLPTGANGRVIFDTGYDSSADALLFETEFGKVSFEQQIDSHEIKDANGSYLVRFGVIRWMRLGRSVLRPSAVETSNLALPTSTTHATHSLMGLFAFQSGVIVLDAPHHVLMIPDPVPERSQLEVFKDSR